MEKHEEPQATYVLEIGSDHAPYRATDDEYTLSDAEKMAKALHHPDWPRSRCIIIRNTANNRPVAYTEYLNGKVDMRPA